jgi:hypothetical protein
MPLIFTSNISSKCLTSHLQRIPYSHFLSSLGGSGMSLKINLYILLWGNITTQIVNEISIK